MSAWGDLSQAQRNLYVAMAPIRFGSIPVVNNAPQLPGNNDILLPQYYTPFEGEINSVLDTGDELFRTINYHLSTEQLDAVRDWVFHHGTNEQIGLLIPNQHIDDNINDNINIINDVNIPIPNNDDIINDNINDIIYMNYNII